MYRKTTNQIEAMMRTPEGVLNWYLKAIHAVAPTGVVGTVSIEGLSWAEVDLVTEFGIPPRQNVHFMMTTGMIAQGQAALYVAETSSGKFAVYTMGQRPDGQAGVMIKRHDMVLFRQAKG